MSFSDDGWGIDDEVKVAASPQKVNSKQAVESVVPPTENTHKELPNAQVTDVTAPKPLPIVKNNESFGTVKVVKDVLSSNVPKSVTYDDQSDDEWDRTPVKKPEVKNTIGTRPDIKRDVKLPPPTTAPVAKVVTNDIDDETLDFGSPQRELSPDPPVERPKTSGLPPQSKSASSSRRGPDFKKPDPEAYAVPVASSFGALPAASRSLKTSGFGGASDSVESSTRSAGISKPVFDGKNSGDLEKSSGFGNQNAWPKPAISSESSYTKKVSGFSDSAVGNAPGSAFGQSNVNTNPSSGFGTQKAPIQKHVSGDEAKTSGQGTWQQPVGFGGEMKEGNGFDNEKRTSGFGNAQQQSVDSRFGSKSSSGFGGVSLKSEGFGGAQQQSQGFTETKPQSQGFGGPQQQAPGFGSNKQQSTGFGGGEVKSGFGVTQKPSIDSRFGSKPSSGFGGDSQNSEGFGGAQQQAPGFGSTKQQSNGFGGGVKHTSEFGNEKRTSGFGNAQQQSVDSRFGSKPSSGFGGVSLKSEEFGGAQQQSTGSGGEVKHTSGFGVTQKSSIDSRFGSKPSSGFGGVSQSSQKPEGFGGAQQQSHGFGSMKQPSTGFGGDNKRSTGFGGASVQSERVESKPTGFGGPKKSVAFGEAPKTSGGFADSKSSSTEAGSFGGFADSKPAGFGETRKASGTTSGFGGHQSASSGGLSNSGFGRSGESNPSEGFAKSNSGGFSDFKSTKNNSEQTSKTFGSDNAGFGSGGSGGFGGGGSGGFGGGGSGGFGGGGSGGFGGGGSGGFGGGGSGGFGGGGSGGFGGGGSGGFGGGGSGGFGGGGSGGFGGGGSGGFGGGAFGNSGGKFGGDGATFGGSERKSGCFNCGKDGHRKDECTEPPKSSGCRNCGENGHMVRECQQPPKTPCRNCGVEGHWSKDCTEPRVNQGCRNCGEEGHFARDCVKERVRQDPTGPCHRCNEEGHWASDCPTRPRDLEGNLLVPYEVQFIPDDEMYNDAVDNDSRIDFDQKVIASMGDVIIADAASFDEFKHLSNELHNNLKRMKMNRPTPIQRAAFFPILHGKDLVACAHTGCGKTLAFLIPLVIKLLEDLADHDGVRDEKPSPGLLIIAPTRELASQTFNMARQLTYETGLKCGLAFGGYSRSANLQHLNSFEHLNILVATMGRLQDFLDSGDITLEKMKFVVLDEADRMVDGNDFGEEVTKILGPPEQRTAQTCLFSASFSETLQREDLPKFVKEGFTMLQVNKFGTANEKIEQKILQVSRSEKRSELCKLIGLDENTCTRNDDARIEKEKTLIFVNSIKYCDTLATFLSHCGVSAIAMHSQQNQESRDKALNDFRRGAYSCMVASNVCARGLNIPSLDHVINYDMPDKNGFDEYVNRIGRTGRAGFTGCSTAFVDESSDREIIPGLINILTEAKKEVPEWLSAIDEQEDAYNQEEGEAEEW